ncbi:cytochrome P450 [Aquihabitans sp. McL0605]|uniref:cytochrome P450 n=1 Tax=Aquihabitans sp. McL0605 TaxID=3415671 RepID=UPI003CE6829C
MAIPLAPADVPDISRQAFWSLPPSERAPVFADLRRSHPVSLQPAPQSTLIPARPFWAVTTHADVQHVSRHADVFCSGEGVGMADIPVEFLELNSSFLVMDAPRHTQLRRIVSGAFTPRRVAQLDEAISAEGVRFVDEFVEAGGGDVVDGLSKRLPLWTISSMMGVPEEMRPDLYRAAEGMITIQDPEFLASGQDPLTLAMECAGELHRIAGELVAARRRHPADDILSALADAQIDGELIDAQELGSIFVLFAVAGNDTTRNSTSHGIKLFADHPDQWERLRADPALMAPAIEEIVRCASPVIHFRRTATTDTELGGAQIAAGDPVVMFYESANRDEGVFADPDRFDIGRDPNPHVGFGGGGPHFCLGANLARAELRATFSRLVERVASFDAGPPDHLTSSFINGIKRMPVEVAPA